MKGIAYPFKISGGSPNSASEEELVLSSINLLFAQERRDRVYDSNNGITLKQYVFENDSASLRADLRREVALSFSRNEDRAELVDISTRSVERSDGSVIVEILVVWRYRSRVYSLSREVQVEE